MTHNQSDSPQCRERRYQWSITILLAIMGFFTGILFEAERMKAQVVTNTVEIRMMRDTLVDIREKLDMLIREQRADFHQAGAGTLPPGTL